MFARYLSGDFIWTLSSAAGIPNAARVCTASGQRFSAIGQKRRRQDCPLAERERAGRGSGDPKSVFLGVVEQFPNRIMPSEQQAGKFVWAWEGSMPLQDYFVV